MPDLNAILVCSSLGGLILAFGVSLLLRVGSRAQDLPPGPKTTPILGNALQFPTKFPCLRFTQWARTYGEICSAKILNRNVIILSSPEAVKGVLEKQGMHTGGRFHSVILDRGVGDMFFVFADMDTDIWRKGRKAVHPLVSAGSINNHLPIHTLEGLQLLCDMLDRPKETYYHLRRTTSSILTYLLYGQRSLSYKGTHIEKLFRMIELMNSTTDLSAHPPVDLVPILQYIPSRWALWKVLCDQLRALRTDIYGTLFSSVTQRLESGTPTDCYMEDLVRNREALGMSMEEIDAAGGAIMDAGSETSASFLQNFVQLLANYPECQRRAQEEIEGVVGSQRMPTVEDFNQLPCVNALIQELHRFRPLLPTGLPHVASKDVFYNGYRIPEGSMIFMNIWGIYRDPELFDEPEIFKPERYLDSPFGVKPGVDTSSFKANFVFGAGRRTCPGEHMANRTITLYAMYLLWAFDISRDGAEGADMSFEQYAKPGVELAPLPFTLSITSRDGREAIIRSAFRELASQEFGA
ncbi:hypothetical protein HGRIS_004424 [Hohenbuehelia grisea]|uniref:Cytochrome P450 n=1 Tax=Hohenbuehelia grisea TaxID=104357 RepID=A0ABR3JCG7_9AGAR